MLVHIFLYVHHSTVLCECTGATERLAIFAKLFLHFAVQRFLCLSVCLYLIAFPDTYLYLSLR
jgi:hypothetical protein